MQTSKKKLTLAKHVYVSVQPLSHSRPLLGQLVHVNFLTPAPWRVLGRLACVAEAVRYYAPHSFSVQTSKKKLTLAKHVYVSVQPLSHSRPLLGQLVHVNFLTPAPWRVLGRLACVAEAVRYYAPHSFSVQTSKKKLTLAKHVYVSVQPLSHSRPLLGQLVHVNFLTPAPWRVLGRLACVAEAVRYYAPHSFSVQTSKKKLTLAKHVYVSVQPLSHSRPLLGQLVHVNFLTPAPWRVLGRLACVAEAVRYYAPHSFSVQTSKKKLTLAKHVYVSVQPLSHSRPLLGQLVHVNFLTPAPWRVLGRLACVAEAVRYYAPHSFSVQTSKKKLTLAKHVYVSVQPLSHSRPLLGQLVHVNFLTPAPWRVLGRLACVAEAVRYYAPHSFSVQTSKKKLTLAKHVYVSVQPLSHSRPLLGQLVHVNFLTPAPWRVLGRLACVAEAVRYYAPHSFSVQTSKKKLTLAKHVYVSVQPLSHSRPLLGQLVHVNFLTPAPWRVLGRLACVAEAVRYYAPHSFSVQTSKKKLTLAKHVYVSVQPLSHSRPLLGQLVHVNFLTPAPWRVLGRLACVAEAVRYYAPHSFSVQTSKKKLTLAKHVYVSVQPLSHSRPLLGQLVHVNFLTPAPWRVLGRLACVAEAVRYYAPHSFSVQTSKKKLTLAKHVYVSVQPFD